MRVKQGGQTGLTHAGEGTGRPSDEVFEATVDYIKGVFQEVLKLSKERMELEATLERYGVDSLVALELNRRFEQDYGNLPATLLFEHNTIKALAEYFIKEFESVSEIEGRRSITPTNAQDMEDTEDMDELNQQTLDYVKDVFAEVLKIGKAKLDAQSTLERYGVDSLVSLELNKRFAQDLGEIPATTLFEHNTLGALTEFFVQEHKDRLIETLRKRLGGASEQGRQDAVAVALEPAHSSISVGKRDLAPPVQARETGLTEKPATVDPEIAVVGMTGRYPDAQNLEEFWENLQVGKSCISEIPSERWDWREHFRDERSETRPGESYTKWGGFVRDIDKFDPLLFAISPREAEAMDPQERIFLEAVWALFETAGYDAKKFSQSQRQIGVFVGAMSTDYDRLAATAIAKGQQTAANAASWSIANRVSYIFGLTGPSMAIDTACSSSLTALHLACESLKRGECHSAIAGGVNLILDATHYARLCSFNMLAADDRTKSFGEEADGFVPGEGVGAVLLKPLNQAIADGDSILGIIKGSWINSDGKTSGYTVPNPGAQAALIEAALRNSAIDPATLSYIEAHGTGTSLGDPIEIAGLKKAFPARGAGVASCSLGSVKSNIGHLESAAGIASLTKVLLCLRHRKLVPSINSQGLNPYIDFGESPFHVQQDLAEWRQPILLVDGEEQRYPRRAGISSFGAGGANAHVIVEEYSAEAEGTVIPGDAAPLLDDAPQLIVLSGKNKERLNRHVSQIAEFIDTIDIKPAQREEQSSAMPAIARALMAMTARVLNVWEDEIDVHEPLADFGCDPLALSAICQAIDERYSLVLTPGELGTEVTLWALANLVAAGRSPDSVREPCEERQTIDYTLRNLAYSLQVGRSPMEERLAVVVRSFSELQDKLSRYLVGEAEIAELVQANVSMGQGSTGLLVDGREGEAFVRIVVDDGKLDKLGRLWVAGLDVDWALLHRGYSPKRVPLPTYPFERRRFWIPSPPVERTTGDARIGAFGALHPLLDANESTLECLRFRKRLAPGEPFLVDHRLDNQVLAPGVMFLEMALAAGNLVQRRPGVTSIHDVVWLKPLLISDKPVDLYVSLYVKNKGTETIRFEVSSGGLDDAAKQVYAKGHLTFAARSATAKVEQEAIDIDAVRSRCTTTWSGEQCYEKFRQIGMQYGPLFQPIQILHRNPLEALAQLRLPVSAATDWTLNASLVDGALQTTLGLRPDTSDGVTYLPYALGMLEPFATLGDQVYVYATRSHSPDPETIRFNLSICDRQGKVLVGLTDFVVKAKASGRPMQGLLYFRQLWEQSAVFASERSSASGTLLLFDRDVDRYKAFKDEFGANTILVTPGEKYQVLGPDRYVIDPREPLQYVKLMDAIVERLDNLPNQIAHIWSASDGISTEALLEQGLAMGVFSLFYLTQAIQARQPRPDIDLVYMYVDTDACPQPQYAGVSGFAKSARMENGTLRYKSVAIADLDTLADVALVDVAIDEFNAPEDIEVRYVNGLRWVHRLREIDQQQLTDSGLRLRQAGVYLITGGAGGIGLIIADYLARKHRGRLILIGRRELDERQRQRIDQLNQGQAEVIYRRTDISDAAQVETLVAETLERYDRIHGVIHAAGVIQDGLLASKRAEEFRAVLAPKVYGTYYLDRATKDCELDFFVLFSSLAGIGGNIGQTDYSYANAFMDNFVSWREGLRSRLQRQGQTIALDWPLWADGTMQVDAQTRARLVNTVGMLPLPADAGIEAFEQALAWHEINQLIVTYGDKSRIRASIQAKSIEGDAEAVLTRAGEAIEMQDSGGALDAQPRVGQQEAARQGMRDDNAQVQIHERLREIIAQALKLDVEELDPKEDLAKYGMDSIIVMELVRSINEAYGCSMTLGELMDGRSVDAIAELLLSQPAVKAAMQDPVAAPTLDADATGDVSSGPADKGSSSSADWPVSVEQERIWLVEQLSGNSSTLNVMSMGFELSGQIDLHAMQRTLGEIVRRHQVLRASFIMVEGVPMQRIASHLDAHLEVLDCRTDDGREMARRLVEEETSTAFDLTRAPLWRFKLLRSDDHEYVFLFSAHHIVFDALSVVLFLQELQALYSAFCQDKPSPLHEVRFQYSDFVQWQQKYLRGPRLRKALAFWEERLRGAPPLLEMPTDRPRPKTRTFVSAHEAFELSASLSQNLRLFSEQRNLTLFTTLIAGFNALLHQHSGVEDLIVGYLYSGRVIPEVESLLGCFAYPLVLRTDVSGNPKFEEIALRTHRTLLEASTEKVPFNKLVEHVVRGRTAEYNPIIQCVFTFMGEFGEISLPDVIVKPRPDLFQAPTEVDLAVRISLVNGRLQGDFSYQKDVFDANTISSLIADYQRILTQAVEKPDLGLNQLTDLTGVGAGKEFAPLRILANFTAEPVADSIRFWLQKLGLKYTLEFADYSQVFQELLAADRGPAKHAHAITVVLIRLEDATRFDTRALTDRERFVDKTRRFADDLVSAFKQSIERVGHPHILCITPASATIASASWHAAFLGDIEGLILSELAAIAGAYAISSEELQTLYPVADIDDRHGDKAGHVPYTPLAFMALGTMLMRRVYAITHPLYKVIVLDCDNTLWQGVCGEDGAKNVVITEEFRALQEFVVDLQHKGMLVCLCSKNSEADVLRVFEEHPDMVLSLDHVVGWRINWSAKSGNIRSLAEELSLSPDSFIFIDDNPVECAEVKANCPEVLTVQLPSDTQSIPLFLEHFWAFDRPRVTEEDKQRTGYYQQNRKREQLRQDSTGLRDFLEGLELQVEIVPATAEQVGRLAQLTQRTNQFNSTTIRRSESDIETLIGLDGIACLAVSVKDRFGDYGLVGIMISATRGTTLEVDSLLLSCRVLGRGVEHRMLRRLGEIARAQGLEWVDIAYRPTDRNQPVYRFLIAVGADFRHTEDEIEHFVFPIDRCRGIVQTHLEATDATPVEVSQVPQRESLLQAADSELLSEIATQLYHPVRILEQVEACGKVGKRRGTTEKYVAARTQMEKRLAELWCKTLHLPEVGMHDNFFEVGGNSLLAVQLIYYIRERFEIELPLNQLLDTPTIAELALRLEALSDTPETGIKPLIYLLSTPRAGSTLLRVMLMGHSEIFAPPELHLLPFDTLKHRTEVLADARMEFLKIGLVETIQSLEGLGSSEAFDKVQSLEASGFTIKQTYEWLQTLVGDRYLVDKSPSYAVDLSVLRRAEELGGKPFYIFLFRHPLAVMESFVRNEFGKLMDVQDDPWVYSERLWSTYNSNLLGFLSGVPDERQFSICYEELVQEPEKTMREFCQKLGVSFQAAMCRPYEGDRMTVGLFDGTLSCGDPNFTRHAAIDASLAKAWEKHKDKVRQMRPDTVELAERLGYKLAGVSAGVPEGLEEEQQHVEYALNPAQTAFMQRFGDDPVWHIVQIFKIVDPAFDVERLANCLQMVVDHHGALRTAFALHDSVWVQREYRQVLVQPDFEDISSYNAAAQAERLSAVERELNARIDIHRAPLLACSILKLTEQEYRMLMVVHHLIADGVALTVMDRDLFSLYRGRQEELQGAQENCRDYVREVDLLGDTSTLDKHFEFWSERLSKTSMCCPKDNPQGDNRIATQSMFERSLQWCDWNIDMAALKVRLFDCIAVALYRQLGVWTETSNPVLAHRLHRRNLDCKRQYAGVVGWFAGDVPVSLDLTKPLEGQLAEFQAQIKALPMGGLTYEVLSNQGRLPRAHAVGAVRLNYQPMHLMPELDGVELEYRLFEPPPHECAYLLDIIARTGDRDLQIIVRYSKEIYREETIRAFVDGWFDNARTIFGEVEGWAQDDEQVLTTV